MEEHMFVDADHNKIIQGWYISTLKGEEGTLIYFEKIWQTKNSWVVGTPSGERFLTKNEVSCYRWVEDPKKYIAKQRSNNDWAKSKLEQLTQSKE